MPKAREALDTEWDRLRGITCWRQDEVREWAEVVAEANKRRETVHVVRIAALCVEKGSELPKGHKDRKYKGRCVVLGDRIVDQWRQAAQFSELSSSPASINASKFGDWWACVDDPVHGPHTCMQSDATQAYTQSKLDGTPTWVRLPRDQWPSSWANMRDPVVPLDKALYGHPDAGGYWERHCTKQLKAIGFENIPEWPSCFWHAKNRMFLVVYVDDFKMHGPAKYMDAMWAEMRSHIDMDPPTQLDKFLGCKHTMHTFDGAPPTTFWENKLLARKPTKAERAKMYGATKSGAAPDESLRVLLVDVLPPKPPSARGDSFPHHCLTQT